MTSGNLVGQHTRRNRPKPAFRPVAFHRTADLSTRGEPYSNDPAGRRGGACIRAIDGRPKTDLHDDTGHRRLPPGRGDGKEVGPVFQAHKSRALAAAHAGHDGRCGA